MKYIKFISQRDEIKLQIKHASQEDIKKVKKIIKYYVDSRKQQNKDYIADVII